MNSKTFTYWCYSIVPTLLIMGGLQCLFSYPEFINYHITHNTCIDGGFLFISNCNHENIPGEFPTYLDYWISNLSGGILMIQAFITMTYLFYKLKSIKLVRIGLFLTAYQTSGFILNLIDFNYASKGVIFAWMVLFSLFATFVSNIHFNNN